MAIARYISQKKKAGEARFPLVLMLEPLFACNFTCSGCGRIHEYADRMKDVLSLEECLKAVDDCGAPVVSICGGEPLLYPHIRELVKEVLDRRRVVYLCTNGWALKTKIHMFHPHPMFNFNIHIDGTREVHDAIVEREGAYDKAVEGVRLVKKYGFTVCTNSTIYKQTSAESVKKLMGELKQAGVDGMLFSPGFDYSDVPDQHVFLNKDEITEKFRTLRSALAGRKVWSTPLFLDFLAGKRDYPCTPWGNVTYNVAGWKAPCYLITDKHLGSWNEFIGNVDWDSYGPAKDQRCNNCMCHCGFEPTVALTAQSSWKDALRMAWWMIR